MSVADEVLINPDKIQFFGSDRDLLHVQITFPEFVQNEHTIKRPDLFKC